MWKHLWSVALLSGASLMGTLACERTAEGVKEDTLALATTASKTADEAKRTLDSEVSAFKAETSAKLEQLNFALAELEAKAENGLDSSKQKLRGEIEETRSKLGGVKADSRSEWQKAKRDLDDSITHLGQRVNAALGKVGNKVEEKVE